jgi:ribosomal protein S4E
MKVGSLVLIIGGTHKDLEGKVVALTDSQMKHQQKVIGDEINEEDGNSFVSVELCINH